MTPRKPWPCTLSCYVPGLVVRNSMAMAVSSLLLAGVFFKVSAPMVIASFTSEYGPRLRAASIPWS